MNPKEKSYINTANTIIKNLNKRGMEGYYCTSKEEVVNKVLELIPEGSSVGWGGSMSIMDSGVMKAVKEGNYDIIDRDTAKSKEEMKAIYARMVNADYFLMSSNAITLDGELINIDGRGNRVSFLIFGPENVIMVVGMNKVVSDIKSGIKRVRDIATPPNTTRLNKNTPCATVGRCMDCLSTDCICNQVVVTRRSGTPNRIKVILVGEELGY
ncbi:MAG: lactate utilization protein [Erysipelotrichaceae bacterium]|nr:lactate utilization protein [Erysipelotrichaceae bacterium]